MTASRLLAAAKVTPKCQPSWMPGRRSYQLIPASASTISASDCSAQRCHHRRDVALVVPQVERGTKAPGPPRHPDARVDQSAQIGARGIRPADDRLVLLRDAQRIAQR